MPATLDSILSATRRRVAASKRGTDLRDLERKAAQHEVRGFKDALLKADQDGVAIVGELKKASPSRGTIRAEFDVASLAKELATAGAAALSVLTDEEFFQGSLSNLQQASLSTRLPCLRKDFMVDEFQMLESRAHGADAVLLIVAALSDAELRNLHRAARAFDLDVLCEVHDEQELARALGAGCEIIGVNSRNLRTFTVDLETPMRLAALIPKNVLRIAESGIGSGQDIRKLRAVGYQGFLIGESLMKAVHPGEMLRILIADAKHATVGS
ncbi:MAG TPA: indole-3-glycerol phosphate synthase TrpC [Terriglobales bacterium]|nr:indole-3-glycerol phosphate synthase TrpC [Terriglobales bacterium]